MEMEAINRIKALRDYKYSHYAFTDDNGKALDMAIKALEKQELEKRKSGKTMRIEAEKFFEEQPIVYDVDKVVSDMQDKSFERYGNQGMGGELVINIDDAVEIVKRGGVDER